MSSEKLLRIEYGKTQAAQAAPVDARLLPLTDGTLTVYDHKHKPCLGTGHILLIGEAIDDGAVHIRRSIRCQGDKRLHVSGRTA